MAKQIVGADDSSPIGKQVEIKYPRLPSLAAYPAKGCLDVMQHRKQPDGVKIGIDSRNTVYEPWLR